MSVGVHFYILDGTDRENSRTLSVGPLGYLVTDHPPTVGDTICLSGHTANPVNEEREMVKVIGTYRVLDRRWTPASYGSMSWPYGERQSGHEFLDVMLAPAPEFFAAQEVTP